MMLDDFQWERMINHLFFLLNFSGKAIYPKKPNIMNINTSGTLNYCFLSISPPFGFWDDLSHCNPEFSVDTRVGRDQHRHDSRGMIYPLVNSHNYGNSPCY